MSRGYGARQISALLVQGIEDAFHLYHDWTLEEQWLWVAPELFVSVAIARRIRKGMPQCHLDMECSVREVLRNAGCATRGRPRGSERRNGRFDIVISRQNGDPWCAIEVKSPIWNNPNVLKSDIQRVRDVVRHRGSGTSTISCGAVAFYADTAKPKKGATTARKKLIDQGKKSLQLAKKLIKDHPGMTVQLHQSRCHKGTDGDAWQAFCLLFKMKKTRAGK